MLILITKDGATVIPKEVKDLDEAKGFADAGFHVEVQTDDGKVPLADMLAAADAHVQPIEQAIEAPADAAPSSSEPAAE